MLYASEKRALERYPREQKYIANYAEYLEGVFRWITTRDLEILKLLLYHPFLTTSQIEMMQFADLLPSSRRVRCNERLRRLYKAQLIDRWFPPVGQNEGTAEAHYILDTAGAWSLSKSMGFKNPKEMKWRKRQYIAQTYQHTRKILDFKAMLHVLNRQLGVVRNGTTGEEEGTIGEIIQFRQEGQNKTVFRRQDNNKKSEIIPDVYCIYKYTGTKAKFFFVEMDNGTEDLEYLKSKIKQYVHFKRSGVWGEDPKWKRLIPNTISPAVLFLAHEESLIKELKGYAKTFHTDLCFLFTTYNRLTEQEFKEYRDKSGRTRYVPNSFQVKLLDPIWFSNREEGLVSL